jgi:hypothetical protein
MTSSVIEPRPSGLYRGASYNYATENHDKYELRKFRNNAL